MRSARAFTLIEVVVVLVVMVVIFAIAAPRQSGAEARYRSRLAAQRVADDIRLADLDAWHQGQTRELQFDTSNDCYTIVGMTDAHGNPYVVDLSEAPYRVAIDTVDFGGTDKVTLDGRGTEIVSGTVCLDVGGRTATATISASGLDAGSNAVEIVVCLLD